MAALEFGGPVSTRSCSCAGLQPSALQHAAEELRGDKEVPWYPRLMLFGHPKYRSRTRSNEPHNQRASCLKQRIHHPKHSLDCSCRPGSHSLRTEARTVGKWSNCLSRCNAASRFHLLRSVRSCPWPCPRSACRRTITTSSPCANLVLR